MEYQVSGVTIAVLIFNLIMGLVIPIGLFIYLNRIGIVNSEKLMDHLTYLTLRDYIILAVILLVMAVLISGRFMNSIFRSSAMGAFREEA